MVWTTLPAGRYCVVWRLAPAEDAAPPAGGPRRSCILASRVLRDGRQRWLPMCARMRPPTPAVRLARWTVAYAVSLTLSWCCWCVSRPGVLGRLPTWLFLYVLCYCARRVGWCGWVCTDEVCCMFGVGAVSSRHKRSQVHWTQSCLLDYAPMRSKWRRLKGQPCKAPSARWTWSQEPATLGCRCWLGR